MFCFSAFAGGSGSAAAPADFTNSIGMKMIRINAGSFMMGQADGDWDEHPVHRVKISKPFYIGATEVTNAQYEQFDPDHRSFRGYNGFSSREDEAVIFVSWHDALRFCEWLSEKEGKPYRLPTEAEWEYACRAGTTTAFHCGNELSELYLRNQDIGWKHQPASLRVGLSKPNAFGLHEMHGNVEEWCYDWYGPYKPEDALDPRGYEAGQFKITRGGSHNTEIHYLRSANRAAALPDDRHWLIGFRIVMGEFPKMSFLPIPEAPRCMRDVRQTHHNWESAGARKSPLFYEPIPYIKEPAEKYAIPMFHHNHCPSITWCPNGDLLAIWFSTESESGREMVILGSRLRAGCDEWDVPSLFFKVPDRNMTGSSLFHDGDGRLIFLNGMEAAGSWKHLAIVMRTSTDNGASWSTPKIVNPYHQPRNQIIHGTIRTKEGWLVQTCDAVPGGNGGTALHISRDNGESWEEITNYGWGTFAKENQTGGWIAGIHASVVQLKDGRLLAFGRGDDIDGRMPMSVSSDMGQTWTYHASEFPPISGGQRLVLMRLREGPIMLVSFTDPSNKRDHPEGLLIANKSGALQRVYGLFAALSYNEGETWAVKKLISAGEPGKTYWGRGHTGEFLMDSTHAEPMGYLAATQTPDGTIHLISSGLHYRFNSGWLETPAP
ncbi:SUMF1/EgtB/PvdO family nonheme iron enzyme [candidate division KSB1 bacterium]|nr:SUMF1/EgtB/PvdO family nonheme iron enzyme [candidate division KSB1 bacterium]